MNKQNKIRDCFSFWKFRVKYTYWRNCFVFRKLLAGDETYFTTLFLFGFAFRPESFWIGMHYSPYNKRLCINLVPFFTIWIASPYGRTPSEH